MSDFEDKLKEIQDKLSAQVEKHRQETERAKADIFRRVTSPLHLTSHLPPPTSHQRTLDLARTGYLNRLDDLAENYFHFEKWFGGSLSQYPTIYCETLEEYYQPFLELLPISEASRHAIMEDLKSRAQAEAESLGGGEFGVHWPGKGCYLNGWLFAYNRAPNPMAALNKPELIPSILATAAHEKFGHGFITEFSAWGKEKKSLHLWRYDIAQRFHLQLSDTPQEALLAQKWSTIFSTSKFCEEGYATWMERFLLHRLQETAPHDGPDFASVARDYSLEGLVEAFHRMQAEAEDNGVKEVMGRVISDLETLFGTAPAEAPAIQETMIELAQFDDMFGTDMAKTFGQPFRYVLGLLLMDKISQHWGDFCAPYAVLLANNISYNIENISVADLNLLVQQDSKFNIDTRLALLSFLHGGHPGDPRALATAAREQLNLAVPEALA